MSPPFHASIPEQSIIESLAEVQRLLLPDSPVIRGLDHAIHYQPAAIAAGDYYDLMVLAQGLPQGHDPERDPQQWGVMVADVSGHGAAAAMEAVQFDAILRTYRGDEPPGGPAGALSYANRHFFSRRQRRHFLTAFAARFLIEPGILQYVSAGHPPAILLRGDQQVLLGEDGDIPLGIDRSHVFSNYEVEWRFGDRLLIYTDGVTEALNADGEQFGIARLQRLFCRRDLDLEAMRDELVDALHKHQGGVTGVDDQTLVLIEQSL